MRLSQHDLFQMDDEWLKKLPAELLLEVSKRLLHDVKELQDRLNRNPTNSSCPPTSQAPWEKAGDAAKDKETPAESRSSEATATDTVGDLPKETAGTSPAVANRPSPGKGSGKSPGRQPGSPGHGRTQKLAVTATCERRPESCTACGLALAADAGSQAYTAWDEIDIAPQVEGLIGLTFSVTRHRLLEVRCACGHVSRALPWRAPADDQWETTELGEWRLVGPRLTGVILQTAVAGSAERRNASIGAAFRAISGTAEQFQMGDRPSSGILRRSSNLANFDGANCRF